jgi:hypothetical protein
VKLPPRRSAPPRVPRPIVPEVSLPKTEALAYSVELQFLHVDAEHIEEQQGEGGEPVIVRTRHTRAIGVGSVEIALDTKTLMGLLDEFDSYADEWGQYAHFEGTRTVEEWHQENAGKMYRRHKQELVRRVSAKPCTVAAFGKHNGEDVALYIRSNHPRRAR